MITYRKAIGLVISLFASLGQVAASEVSVYPLKDLHQFAWEKHNEGKSSLDDHLATIYAFCRDENKSTAPPLRNLAWYMDRNVIKVDEAAAIDSFISGESKLFIVHSAYKKLVVREHYTDGAYTGTSSSYETRSHYTPAIIPKNISSKDTFTWLEELASEMIPNQVRVRFNTYHYCSANGSYMYEFFPKNKYMAFIEVDYQSLRVYVNYINLGIFFFNFLVILLTVILGTLFWKDHPKKVSLWQKSYPTFLSFALTKPIAYLVPPLLCSALFTHFMKQPLIEGRIYLALGIYFTFLFTCSFLLHTIGMIKIKDATKHLIIWLAPFGLSFLFSIANYFIYYIGTAFLIRFFTAVDKVVFGDLSPENDSNTRAPHYLFFLSVVTLLLVIEHVCFPLNEEYRESNVIRFGWPALQGLVMTMTLFDKEERNHHLLFDKGPIKGLFRRYSFAEKVGLLSNKRDAPLLYLFILLFSLQQSYPYFESFISHLLTIKPTIQGTM